MSADEVLHKTKKLKSILLVSKKWLTNFIKYLTLS